MNDEGDVLKEYEKKLKTKVRTEVITMIFLPVVFYVFCLFPLYRAQNLFNDGLHDFQELASFFNFIIQAVFCLIMSVAAMVVQLFLLFIKKEAKRSAVNDLCKEFPNVTYNEEKEKAVCVSREE